ncbi:hypothetical protein QQ054_31920 [Oscillatoria amoena NRMC-F 0135]|nr:hypothetical protein [Oscillatoria amoena NRMC-F 0135]
MEFKEWYTQHVSKSIREKILEVLNNPDKPNWATQRLNNLLSQRVQVHPAEKQAIEAIAGQELEFKKKDKKQAIVD